MHAQHIQGSAFALKWLLIHRQKIPAGIKTRHQKDTVAWCCCIQGSSFFFLCWVNMLVWCFRCLCVIWIKHSARLQERDYRYDRVSPLRCWYIGLFMRVFPTCHISCHILRWNSSLQLLLNTFPSYLCNVHTLCVLCGVCRSFSLSTVMNRSISSGQGVLSIPGAEKWSKLHSLTSDTQQRAK